MKTFVTSDTHFGHSRIIGYDNETFSDIDERDQFILDQHNKVVGQEDHVWHLGDVAFTNEKLDWYLANARGHIHLIRGNHDDRHAWPAAARFTSAHEAYYLHWSEIPDCLIRTLRVSFYLSHYSCRTWRNHRHGSINLYGDAHGNLPPLTRRTMDVGVRVNGYTPVSLESIVTRMGVTRKQKHDPENQKRDGCPYLHGGGI